MSARRAITGYTAESLTKQLVVLLMGKYREPHRAGEGMNPRRWKIISLSEEERLQKLINSPAV